MPRGAAPLAALFKAPAPPVCNAASASLKTRKVTAEDLEVAWTLQSAIFYYGVRRFVYQVPVHLSKQVAIARALEMFFGGYSAVLQNRKIKVAGSGISICGRIRAE